MKKVAIGILSLLFASMCYLATAHTLEDNAVCKKCDWSAGISICILADEGEDGFKDCQAGTNCVFVNGVQMCFQNSCVTRMTCILAPGIPIP